MARRYQCNDWQRKFSIPHVQSGPDSKPDELIWLLNEISMLTSKLTDLLAEVNDKMELARDFKENLPSNGSAIHGSESNKS